MSDAVNSPSHYTSGGIECIDAIEAALTPEEARGFRKGNAMKYIWRAGKKGSYIEDLEKASWYLEREIQKASADGRVCGCAEFEVCDTCQGETYPSPSEIRKAWVEADAWPGEGPVGSDNEPTPDPHHRSVHTSSGRPPAGMAVIIGGDW